MCKAKADGGKRCACPSEVRNAKRRALDADRKAEQAAIAIGAADPLPGQHSFEDLCDRFPNQLALLKSAWKGRDPEYVKRIEAAETMAALRGVTSRVALPVEFDRESLVGVRYPKSIRTVEGREVDFHAGTVHGDGSQSEWESIDHFPVRYSRNGGKTWQRNYLGILHNPNTGEYLVWREDDKIEGVVGADINEAAAFLTPEERAQLGLPEAFDPHAFAREQAGRGAVR